MSERLAAAVAVVIATRDRRERLLTTLGRLTALDEQPDVLVVDNGSRDGTAPAVRARYPQVEVLRLHTDHGAAARNMGLRALDVPYVALCDDDSWWAPGALTRAAAALRRSPRLAVLAARVLVGERQVLDPVSARMVRSPLPAAPGLPGPRVLGFVACGAVVRRAAVLGVGGFDQRYGIGGEERRLAYDLARAGWTLAYAPDVVAHHEPPPSGPRRRRRVRAARNDLWTTWLHRSLPAAAHRSVTILGQAGTLAPLAACAALAGVPWIARERRPLGGAVEAEVRLVERQKR
ncbi:MAG TPA: glycosyltransferase [Solirubrobacteraceae bacterium]